ncbi:MAG: hypothetical protein ABWK00_05160 [Desulfurococcaceae archaeon]
MIVKDTRAALREFLAKYGERAELVLRIAFEVSTDPNVDHRLGDFSYKHLVARLLSMGISYNPANLLRIMERDYGIIDKSYVSSNQTWWRFVDQDAVREALSGGAWDDPKISVILVKYRSLEPLSMLEALRRLYSKQRLSDADRKFLKRLAFEELPLVIQVMGEMEEHEEAFSAELKILREIVGLAEKVSAKLSRQVTARELTSAATIEGSADDRP